MNVELENKVAFLASRITSMSNTQRRLRAAIWACSLLLAALGIGLVWHLVPGEVVRARRIEVLDRKGDVRVVIGAKAGMEGAAWIALVTPPGQEVASLSYNDGDHAYLRLDDTPGRDGNSLSMRPGAIGLYDDHGHQRLTLFVGDSTQDPPEGPSRIEFAGGDTRTRLMLGVSQDKAGLMIIRSGRERAFLDEEGLDLSTGNEPLSAPSRGF